MGKRILSYILAILEMILIAVGLSVLSAILLILATKFEIGVIIIGVLLLLFGLLIGVTSIADNIYNKIK